MDAIPIERAARTKLPQRRRELRSMSPFPFKSVNFHLLVPFKVLRTELSPPKKNVDIVAKRAIASRHVRPLRSG